MINAILFDSNNKKYDLRNIIDFQFRSQVWTHCSYLEINFLDINICSQNQIFDFNNFNNSNYFWGTVRFEKIKLVVDEALVFSGQVENQIFSKDGMGHKMKIIAKSEANILAKLKALPVSYNNISLQNILDKYILPYGFVLDTERFLSSEKLKLEENLSCCGLGEDFLRTSLETFIVLPQTSHWEVLNLFLKKSLKLSAFSLGTKIIISGSHKNSDAVISNQPELNQKIYKNIYNNIFNFSKISVNFKPQDFSSQDSKNNVEVFVELPGFFEAQIGQTVLVKDDIFNNQLFNKKNFDGENFLGGKLLIEKKDCIFKNNELKTRLVLNSDF